MSHVMCVTPTSAFSRVGLPKGRYDYWNRKASDRFRLESAALILGNLPSGGDRMVDVINDVYHYYTHLEKPRWDNADTLYTDLRLAQARALFSKDEDMLSPVDREKVAWKAFLASEGSCGKVNRMFFEQKLTPEKGDVDAIVLYAQQKIASILGECPSVNELAPTFGPGAAATTRKNTTARFKLSDPPSISSSGTAIAVELAETMALWYEHHDRKIDVVSGVLEFVPKNAETLRTIVIEPSLSGAGQRAVGGLMKTRLLAAGINLYDQMPSRLRAKRGSVNGVDDCTLDIKTASDSIAYKLVENTFPIDWVVLFDALRSESVSYKGKIHHLNKFSSMGNGYTFELESLLFYSLAYGIATRFNLPFDLTVYGDDLICNRQLADGIISWFPKFGLTINVEKSFVEGNFRESCGGDFFLGVDVRPFFLKGRVTFHKVVCFYNHLVRKPHQDPDHSIRDFLLSFIPERYRVFGPDGLGDGHLVTMTDVREYCRPHGRTKGWSGYIFDTFIEVPTRNLSECVGDVLLPAYQASLIGAESRLQVVIRDKNSLAYRLCFQNRVSDRLRSYYLDSFMRQCEADSATPIDHYVVRKKKQNRVLGRKIRVYVLG